MWVPYYCGVVGTLLRCQCCGDLTGVMGTLLLVLGLGTLPTAVLWVPYYYGAGVQVVGTLLRCYGDLTTAKLWGLGPYRDKDTLPAKSPRTALQ